jgi:hypothetical protein
MQVRGTIGSRIDDKVGVSIPRTSVAPLNPGSVRLNCCVTSAIAAFATDSMLGTMADSAQVAVPRHAQVHVMNADDSSLRRLTELSSSVFNAFLK